MLIRVLFFLCLLSTLTPWISAPGALALGLGFGLVLTNPYRAISQKTTRILLQICVIGLGFGMNLHEVIRAGRSGLIYTALGIGFALALGSVLGKLLGVESTIAFLIAVGTAICGGSAIAAVGPVVEAKDEDMTVSLGTVFVLNAIALLSFPLIGAASGLTQTQFGLWAALAIHDTSSVVGAGAKFGAVALSVATTVKLARALWIVPVTMVTAAVKRTEARVRWPWFILLFACAAILNTYVDAGAPVYQVISTVSRKGMSVTLFLIGSTISVAALRSVGVKAISLGILLWVIVAGLSLALIRAGIISL